MERRKSNRVSFRNIVRFGPVKPPEYPSIGIDLSYTGLGVETYWAFEPGTTLFLTIDDTKDGNKRYVAEGTVIWANRLSPGVVQPETTGMGIKFTLFNKELADLYEEKIVIKKPQGH
jgi:hypothetical protein